MNTTSKPMAFAVLAVVVAGLVSSTSSAEAGIFDHLNIFGKKHQQPSRPIMTPFDHPTYGYHATRWRTFPGANYPQSFGGMYGDSQFMGDNGGFYSDPMGGFGSEYIQESPQLPPTSAFNPVPSPSTLPVPATSVPAPSGPAMSVPAVTGQQNTDALHGLQDALIPPSPHSARPISKDLPQPAAAPFPPAKRMSYSIQVAPNYGRRGDFGLPRVRPAVRR
jgi:hypothetical protein